MFKPGDEVICINDKELEEHIFCITEFTPWIVEGQKYTIRDVFYFPECPPQNQHGVWLEEVRGPWNFVWKHEQSLRAERFRKIEKKKTDIGVLTSLLNTAPAKELEPTA